VKLLVGIIASILIMSAQVSSARTRPDTRTPDAPDIQRQIRQILSAPEYNRVYAQGEQSNFAQQFLDKLGKRIRDFILWLRDSLSFNGKSAGRVASFIFASLVLIGFAALVVLLIRKLLRSGRSRESMEPSYDLDSVHGLPSAKPLIREAASLAEAGDYRSAFRCAYMASISHLDETNALRFQRGRTNWEYLRELVRGGHERPCEALRRITSTFDRKFYGRETCGRQDYLDALAVYERISSEAAA